MTWLRHSPARQSRNGRVASNVAAAQAYRRVLADRFAAYRDNGLDGIANYVHDRKRLEPSQQLRAVEATAEDVLTTFFPDFWTALTTFPAGQSPDVSSQFFWVKRAVEGRPAFILIHQMTQAADDFLLLSQRQFYVGHTYESLQVLSLALPTDDGTIVFSLNSVATDQITGFFSGLAQSIGQTRTRDSMVSHFENVRQTLEN